MIEFFIHGLIWSFIALIFRQIGVECTARELDKLWEKNKEEKE